MGGGPLPRCERYSVTAEYLLTRFEGRFNGVSNRSSSDGIYVQTDYRFAPEWTGMLRYDLTFSDRNDRDGREYADETGGDRSERFARDLTIGLKWLPDEHWGEAATPVSEGGRGGAWFIQTGEGAAPAASWAFWWAR